MAWWGIAYAAGPNYNKPWEAFDEDDAKRSLRTAFDATTRAEGLSGPATETEKALIRALRRRYPSPIPAADMCPWNDEYAAAMRTVHEEHGNDPDVAALFAEAMMNRTPWALWELESGAVAPGADTAEAIVVLEAAMRRRRDRGEAPHAGLLHMYIHVMEMSPHPERALPACDRLRNLVPDAGHLRHMPTHIDVQCGDYRAVVETNHAAIEADRKFMEREGSINFYSLYRCHNYHFKMYGAMFLGQYRPAIAAAEEMITTLPEELLAVRSPPMADWLEGFVSMKQHVLVRFGKWKETVEQAVPDNRELFCVTTAMMRYAMSVAHGALGNVAAAQQEAARFEDAVHAVPESRYVFNNTCVDILAIAREMMLGEFAYRRGDHETAFSHLRRSVELDDNPANARGFLAFAASLIGRRFDGGSRPSCRGRGSAGPAWTTPGWPTCETSGRRTSPWRRWSSIAPWCRRTTSLPSGRWWRRCRQRGQLPADVLVGGKDGDGCVEEGLRPYAKVSC